jgi:UDP-glucose 4-epimerase
MADPAYANNELGWVATETVEETLRSAWAWELNLAKQREAKAE